MSNSSRPDSTIPSEKWIGKAVPRMEDIRFLKGKGKYVDDITLPGQLYAHFVRSPHPHAKIINVNLDKVRSISGVIAAYSSEDLGGLKEIKPNWILPGSSPKGRPVLAHEKVRHVGEAVVAIIADTPEIACDAGEFVDIQYEVLDFVTNQSVALTDEAPKLHDDLENNQATIFRTGTKTFEKAVSQARHHIKFKLRNQRLIPFSIEARAVNADYNSSTGNMTVYVSQQLPHMFRRMLAEALAFPEHKLRVISPDVGGGFGPKMHFYPEDYLIAYASITLGQPVKWTEKRRENAVATTHGRDHEMMVEVAVEDNGKITGLRVFSTANVGAYLSSMGSGVPTVNVGLFMLGVYFIEHSDVIIRCAYTNTTPVDAYRGAGRPEAAYLIERTMDRVAQELNLDPADVRLVNFIPDLPYRQPTGVTIDTGQYVHTLNQAKELIDYDKLRQDQYEARQKNRYIGLGISNYTETCGVGPAEAMEPTGFDRGGFESAVVRVHPDGHVTILSGSHSHGQGHVTTFAQIAADELGIAPDNIEVIQGDTDIVPFGIGTFNSRSVVIGGSAVKVAAERIASKMNKIAACLLKSSTDEIERHGEIFKVQNSNSSVTLTDIARAAWTGQGLTRDLSIGLEETEFYHPTAMASPYGAHIALVEVDIETGEIDLQRYLAVDDCGVIINPLLASGQVHGGVLQGIGQALYEDGTYDLQGMPPLEPSIPRFDFSPRIEASHTITPTPTNPLGAKGLGEAGTIGAPPAIVNAVIDALWPLGVKDLDMPLTPERVLNSIKLSRGEETFQ
ncbi:MAG: xanthine dehydrogenase family protein molybdopterin-binding subunit [Methyloligellaceae bacterium]